jgi:hypothetical protein
MANRYPLTLDTSDGQIKELPNGDNLNLTGNSIVGVLDVTAQGTLTAATINAANININSSPLAEVATSGDYNDLINKPLNLSQFTNDSNFVSSGDNISLLTNDANYLTSASWLTLTNKPVTVAELGLVDGVSTSTPVSFLPNDVGYVTASELESGTISVNSTGDIKGSVFGDDSTVLVDGVLSSINLDGTVRGNIVPFVDVAYSIGTPVNEFANVYAANFTGNLQGSVFSDDSTTQIIDGFNSIVTASNVTINVPNSAPELSLVYDGSLPDADTLQASIKVYEGPTLTHAVVFGENQIGLLSDTIGLTGFRVFNDRAVATGLSLKVDPNDVNNRSAPVEALEVVGNIKANIFKGDLIGSVFAEDSSPIVDATDGSLYYAPTTPSDWNGTAPTTVGAALDRLATLVKTLNGGTGA